MIEMEDGIEPAASGITRNTGAIQFRSERFRSPKNGLPDRLTLAGRRPYPHYLQRFTEDERSRNGYPPPWPLNLNRSTHGLKPSKPVRNPRRTPQKSLPRAEGFLCIGNQPNESAASGYPREDVLPDAWPAVTQYRSGTKARVWPSAREPAQ